MENDFGWFACEATAEERFAFFGEVGKDFVRELVGVKEQTERCSGVGSAIADGLVLHFGGLHDASFGPGLEDRVKAGFAFCFAVILVLTRRRAISAVAMIVIIGFLFLFRFFTSYFLNSGHLTTAVTDT